MKNFPLEQQEFECALGHHPSLQIRETTCDPNTGNYLLKLECIACGKLVREESLSPWQFFNAAMEHRYSTLRAEEDPNNPGGIIINYEYTPLKPLDKVEITV